MTAIDEIMAAVELYGNKAFAAGASWPASNGEATHAAFDLIMPLITQAIADARADGAREMRDVAAAVGYASAPGGDAAHEVFDTIRALPLPAKRVTGD